MCDIYILGTYYTHLCCNNTEILNPTMLQASLYKLMYPEVSSCISYACHGHGDGTWPQIESVDASLVSEMTIIRYKKINEKMKLILQKPIPYSMVLCW